MDFQQVVQQRRMVRAFCEDPLAPEVVERILANGNRAPSAGFSQGYGFLVLEVAEDRARFWETMAAAGHPPDPAEIAAPLLVVPLASKAAYLDRYAEPDKGWTDRDEGRWPVPYWYIDTGFAALLMLLTAVDEELGGLFFGLPPEVITAVRAAFGVPDDHEPIGVLAIGHPAPGGSTGSAWRGRRSLEQVVHRATGELISRLPTMRSMTTRTADLVCSLTGSRDGASQARNRPADHAPRIQQLRGGGRDEQGRIPTTVGLSRSRRAFSGVLVRDR